MSRRRRWQILTAVATGYIGVLLIVVLLLTILKGNTNAVPTLLPLLVSFLSILFTAIVAFYLGRSRGRVDNGTLRIALGGSPGAGKTVFANSLMSILMNGANPDLRFTVDTRTATSVITAFRRLSRGEWPSPTSVDGIFRYSGSIERRASFTDRLFRYEPSLRIEVADNAGELWQELGTESREGPASAGDEAQELISSTFFEYVVEAHSLLYFISAHDILYDLERVRSTVQDASSVVQLMLSTRGSRRQARRTNVAIVLSMCDLLSDDEWRQLIEIVVRDTESNEKPQSTFLNNLQLVARLARFLSRSVDAYTLFAISSVDAIASARIVDSEALTYALKRADRSPRRMLGSRSAPASEDSIVAPLRWTLNNYELAARAGVEVK